MTTLQVAVVRTVQISRDDKALQIDQIGLIRGHLVDQSGVIRGESMDNNWESNIETGRSVH